jgi:hypothetical protein
VEQAFQACVQHHQKINGLQPPSYVRDLYQGATSVVPQARHKILSFRAEKDHPQSG